MISVILCGGVGARLWPVSRELYPKPFLRLRDGESFLQKALRRGALAAEAERLMIVTNRNLFLKAAETVMASRVKPDVSYVLEPFGRNTGPAIAVAASIARRRFGSDMPLLVLPADHLILNRERFSALTVRALELARRDRLVTFGITPTAPETGLGYIEADGERVVRFVEKPSLEKAEEYVASGRFLWNSGMFCFKAGVMLEELARHAPEVLAATERCVEASAQAEEEAASGALPFELDAATFDPVPSISIDYAVFEKSDRVATVRGDDLGWNDVGSWSVLSGLDAADGDGNRMSKPENVVAHDSRNCDINSQERLVAVVGVENLLIVDTPDALLVADKSREQEVKIVYNRLREADHEAYKHHRTVYRPWGSFTLLERGARFKIKRLVIHPGASISLQRHHNRSEHWIAVSGMAEVVRDDETYFVNTNESTYIKAGSKHRVGNPGKVELILIEVQSGDYLGEDDIERFSDMYGRC